MASRHRRIQVPRDPELERAIRRGREVSAPGAPASQIVRALALRGAEALERDRQEASRSRAFLIAVVEGDSGLDLDGLRSVRDLAWR
jgi:hypothetical protein